MTNNQSLLPSTLKLSSSKSTYTPSSFHLNISLPPTKLSQYLKDRSVSRCKQLIKMISVDNPSKITKGKSAIQIIQKSKKIQGLSEEIMKEIMGIKGDVKRSRDVEELEEVQGLFRKCLALLRGTKEDEGRSSENIQKSMLEIQIQGVMKGTKKKEPYARQRRKSKQMTSMRVLDKCDMNRMDSIMEGSNNVMEGLKKEMIWEGEKKNMVKGVGGSKRKSRMEWDK